MGLFGKGKDKGTPAGMPQGVPQGAPQRQSVADMMKMAKDMQAAAMQQNAAIQDATAGTQTGSAAWARAVMSIIAPPEPGFVKRCNCVSCGAPKQLPSVTAYVYCDFCGSLADYDLRRACEGDVMPGPEYVRLVNGSQPQLQAAQAAGDRDGYRAIQRQIFDGYVTHVPAAVSHRARNDQQYREQLVNYMAEMAVVTAFEPQLVALTEQMKQRVMSLKYSGSMMATKVDPDTFWPVVETLTEQLRIAGGINKANGVADMDPDHAGPLTDKMAWSGFCQGWLGMLPDDAAAQLLEQTGLKNQYVAVEVVDGQPRSCAGCGGKFQALPGAKAVVCEGCGRTLDVGSAEIPCANCGGTMTLPKGVDNISCPFCQSNVEKVGIL